MPLFPPPGLAETIVQELRSGPQDTHDLIRRMQQRTPPPTLQGIYKALRALRTQDIVLMHHHEVTLNLSWLRQLESFVSLAERAYQDPHTSSGHFLQMRDGDRITYAFKNPVQVDAFWNHMLYILCEAIPGLDRWYAYASHCWFLLGRREEELALQTYMKQHGIRYLFTVGHRLPLDRALTKDFDGLQAQYAMLEKPLFTQRPNHLGIVLNVIEDYIVEAQYDKQTVERIERFYKTHHAPHPSMIEELKAIVSQPSRIKLSIMRHPAKAEALRRQLEKRFYLKKIRDSS